MYNALTGIKELPKLTEDDPSESTLYAAYLSGIAFTLAFGAFGLVLGLEGRTLWIQSILSNPFLLK